MSLTLGGYDANRFEPHNVRFSLNATTRQPQVLVRAITASVSDIAQAPTSGLTHRYRCYHLMNLGQR